MSFELGKCYEVTSANGSKIKFKFIGDEPAKVLINNQEKLLVEALGVFTSYIEIDCSELNA